MEKIKRRSFLIIFALIFIMPFAFILTACGSTDPSKLIFKNSPYVEYDDSWTSSDWDSWNFEIKKNGNYSFDYTHHKYSIKNKNFTEINFDKVEGTWEYIGTFTQDYKVYKTDAKLVSVPKNQSFAIYKLNGLVGGFYGTVEDDGTINKEVGSYQGYCVYRYGDKSSWTAGKTEAICIFFTNETVNEALLDSTIDNNSLSTGWRYGSIGKVNYYHTVRV